MFVPAKEVKALSLFTAIDATRPWTSRLGLYSNDAIVASDARSIVVRGEIPEAHHLVRCFDPAELVGEKSVELAWKAGEERSFLPIWDLVPDRTVVASALDIDVFLLERLAKISRALGDKGASPWRFFCRGPREPLVAERVPVRDSRTSKWTVVVYPYRSR